jgi:hypothetical protein
MTYDLNDYQADLALSPRAARVDGFLHDIAHDLARLAAQDPALVTTHGKAAAGFVAPFRLAARRTRGIYNPVERTLTYVIGASTADADTALLACGIDPQLMLRLATERLHAYATRPDVNKRIDITTTTLPHGWLRRPTLCDVVRVYLDQPSLAPVVLSPSQPQSRTP